MCCSRKKKKKHFAVLPSGNLCHLNGHSHLIGCDINYVGVPPNGQNRNLQKIILAVL